MRPSARGLRLRAPAKLNLGLRVLARRPDGYHEIESLFVPIDLADELELILVPGGAERTQIELDGHPSLDLPRDASNLAARAGRAFLEAARLRYTLQIRLRKRIPVGAGLGGGSSDAGTVLRALAKRFPAALSGGVVERLARSLGADVPFFLNPRPARVRGIGERIDELPPLPRLPVLVVTPGPPLPTPDVYRAYDAEPPTLTRPRGGRRMPLLYGGFRGGQGRLSFDALRCQLVNDLEPASCRLRPAIGRVRRQMEVAGARAVGMSGSGPTVFGVFESIAAACVARTRGEWGDGACVEVATTLDAA